MRANSCGIPYIAITIATAQAIAINTLVSHHFIFVTVCIVVIKHNAYLFNLYLSETVISATKLRGIINGTVFVSSGLLGFATSVYPLSPIPKDGNTPFTPL